MNCANVVYCPPEVEGESLDVNFKKDLVGLGLTDINIFPHYDVFKTYILDGKQYIPEIIIPDSYQRKILALDDGSYILIKDSNVCIYGTHHIIEKGIIKDCL
jgi:dipeptidase E